MSCLEGHRISLTAVGSYRSYCFALGLFERIMTANFKHSYFRGNNQRKKETGKVRAQKNSVTPQLQNRIYVLFNSELNCSGLK